MACLTLITSREADMSAQGTAGISVPACGAAPAPISQAFQPNLRTGTGEPHRADPLPAGRRNLTPSLSLTCSSGNPNSPFGLDWMLNVQQASRRTDRRIPRYDDTADTFMLPQAEELVPVPADSRPSRAATL